MVSQAVDGDPALLGILLIERRLSVFQETVAQQLCTVWWMNLCASG